jgi:hypothetical protein
VVAIAGPISGSITREKIRQWRSRRSGGLVQLRGDAPDELTIKKTKNASVARNLGRISGTNVFTKPRWLKMMYCGTTTTWMGSMIVTA